MLTLRALAIVSFGILVTGCGADTPGDSGETSEALGEPACAPPARATGSETSAYQRDVLARLTGAADVAPGLRLTDRATPSNREAARVYLSRLFEDVGLTPMRHDYGTGSNVYAALPSTAPESETIVLGAHFDSVSRSPGANDNATGVALVYAVARRLTALPCRARSVLFVLFDEEERGLVGSRAFAQKLQRDDVRVHSVHTVDQMGWDRDGDRLIELERPDTGLADLYRAGVGELGVSVPIVITATTSSDHSSFRPAFRAVGITEGYRSGNTTPDYHRPTDTIDKVDFPYLLSTTELVAHVLEGQLR